MIKYLPQSLINAAAKILSESYLFEMAYERKYSLNQIGPHARQLATKMVMISHAVDSRDLSHWHTTTNAHLQEIFDLTFLKGKKRVNRDDLHELMIDGPLGEYDDYLRHHAKVCDAKTETSFSPPTPEEHERIKQKLASAIELMLSSKVKAPKVEDIR